MTAMKYDTSTKDDSNIVEMLRVKTEEADMNSYLKSTFSGGYSKKSVLEYLAILRKQQHNMAETFNNNQQAIYEEKQNIKKSYDILEAKLSKIESEYHAQKELLIAEKQESKKHQDNVSQLSDLIERQRDELKHLGSLQYDQQVITLEEELKMERDKKDLLVKKIEELDDTVNNQMTNMEQLKHELDAQKHRLIAEKQETKKQSDMVSQLSGLLEAERDEVKYWKSVQNDGQVGELTGKIYEVTEQLAVQTEFNERLNSELINKEQTINVLTTEVTNLKSTIEAMSQLIENMNVQNDKLILVNRSLNERMEEEFKKTMILIQDKSEITIEKLIALKKLSDADAKISLFELQISKYKKCEDISSIT